MVKKKGKCVKEKGAVCSNASTEAVVRLRGMGASRTRVGRMMATGGGRGGREGGGGGGRGGGGSNGSRR